MAVSTSLRTSAQYMGHAVNNDPEFQLPQYPRFIPGLVVVPVEDGLLIEGAAQRQLLRGHSATKLLPQLIPQLDGTKSLTDLAKSITPGSPESLHAIISLLYTRGLLEDAAADNGQHPRSVSPDYYAFLRRHVDATRRHRSAAEALQRLSTVSVFLVADGGMRSLLRRELMQHGITHIREMDPGPLPKDLQCTILLAAVDGLDPAWMSSLGEECSRKQIPWLRASFHGESAEIGPYFDGEYAGCYGCFRTTWDHPRYIESPLSDLRRQTWASLVAAEAMHVLTWALPPVTIAECVRINFDNWSQQRQLALRMPGCPTCLPEGESASRTFVLPHAYEQSIMTPPRNLLNPKIHQGHYQPANLMITKDFKRYPASPKIPLPPPSQEPVPRGFIEAQTCHVTQARQLDVTTFSALLRRVGGLRSLEISSARDRVQRWIPTGGNLGSVQIYPLVRSVSGLRPGVYHYQPLEHALIDLPSSCDETELAALMEQSCPDVDPE